LTFPAKAFTVGLAQPLGNARVKITLLPSSVSEYHRDQLQFLSSYLVNDTLAIDAGCIGFFGSPQEQARIKHVLITHTHLDHIASLPIFVENAFEAGGEPVTIHGTEAVLDCLRRDLFNDRLWPDFVSLSGGDVTFLKLQTLVPGQPVFLEGLRITPVPVNHVVPTVGFLVEDDAAAVVLAADTGPTQALWERANQAPDLKAVFLEVTFPDAMAGLAELAKHLTPATFAVEVGKLKQRKEQPAVIAVHLKPRFREQIVSELKALGLANLQIARFGRAYEF
jgi:cAMP phosphodiesterase